MIYAYLRVSTKYQERDGHYLEQQKNEILAKYENAILLTESHTAKTKNRPVLDNLMAITKAGDLIVISQLDRLARNVVDGINIVSQLFHRGISIHVLNVGLLENTPMGKFFLTTLLAVAEMERAMIIERTAAGKEIAKTRDDYREGRPKVYSDKKIQHALMLLETNSYKEVEGLTGISKSTLYRAKRDRTSSLLPLTGIQD